MTNKKTQLRLEAGCSSALSRDDLAYFRKPPTPAARSSTWNIDYILKTSLVKNRTPVGDCSISDENIAGDDQGREIATLAGFRRS
jgi:hypothetical protein